MGNLSENPFLAACRGHCLSTKPIWLMRQAGRILPSYRDLKNRVGSIMTLFKSPDLAAQITLMPVEQLGVDAAILFADILTPLEPMGCTFDFKPGPIFAQPVRERTTIDALRPIETEADLAYVVETIRLVRRALPAAVPLIGFCGAPYTLATYMAEGGGAKQFSHFRRLFYRDPQAAHSLLDKLTEVSINYLSAQVRAGAQAIQVFDTWIGLLSAAEFIQLGLPYLQRIFAALAPLQVPRIYFANGAGHFLPLLSQVGADIISLDWRIELDQAHSTLGPNFVLQGNLDPSALFAPPQQLRQVVEALLLQTEALPHIFNLGHGLHPDTPYDNVRLLVDTVHQYVPQNRS